MGVAVSKLQNHFSIANGFESGETKSDQMTYDYDLIIIGGGSGGLGAAKAAADFGKRVALCDYVKPSPAGSSWGLGGTCVNVGCIPKKLMHCAALLGHAIEDASAFGWNTNFDFSSHDWNKMVKAIQNHIQSLNWGYKVTLQNDKIDYINALATFVDNHTVQLTYDKSGENRTVTGETFIIATGGRPKYLEIPGGRPGELCITSDDIFSLKRNPGKTLLVGASYIALECAGFLAGFGIETVVMARSVLLRGFDQQLAEMVGDILEDRDVHILRNWIPLKIEDVSDEEEIPKLLVTSQNTITNEISEDIYNTVILAVGRAPCTGDLNLDPIGVKLNSETKKIITDEKECSSVPNIFAIGDVAENRPELTPAAIQAGKFLVKRLYGGSTEIVDYQNVPTTVFTPLEYGCVGMSEEEALSKYGNEDITVYHISQQPLEFILPSRDPKSCYSKIICVNSENERVVGFHYLGPNAGEITQGFALAVRLRATKSDFDSCIGIHPTCAELFTTLNVTKGSGKEWKKTSC